MRIIFGLLIGLALVAGCGRPETEAPQTPATETWNPPRDSTNVDILTSSVQGGNTYKFEVPRARIEALPDWDPSSNTIPFLPQQAAQLALARYRYLHPSVTNDLQASSISLQTISWFRSKWAYHVFLVPPEGARPFVEPKDSIRTMVVLLDGTVVDPVIDRGPKRGPDIRL
jgi:hypothetical protein